jgi:two-component sensor histidine kinase
VAAQPDILTLDIGRTRDCARIAREAVTKALVGDTRSDSIELIASELVTNAFVHGSGDIRLQLISIGTSMKIAVTCDTELVALDLVAPLESNENERGRGLALVRESSTEMGYEISDSKLTVWAKLTAHNLG